MTEDDKALVARLRMGGANTALYAAEAADAITRLSADLAAARAGAEYDKRQSAHKDTVIDRLNADADALRAENERLREALGFYADIQKYPAPLTGGMGALWQDCGDLARAALSSEGGK